MIGPQTERLAAGMLLAASPNDTQDPTFGRTVILLVDCEPNGITTGIALNRPLAEPAMSASALALLFVSDPGQNAYWGGPMGHDPAILAELDSPAGLEWFHLPHQQQRPFPLPSVGVVAVAEHPSAFEGRIRRARVFVGLCVWGRGGAEREVRQKLWHLTSATVDDVFSSSPERLWQDALDRPGVHLSDA